MQRWTRPPGRSTRSSVRREAMRLLRSEHTAGWVFILPAVVLIVVFGLIPIGRALLLSFQSSHLLSPPQSVGLAKYPAPAHQPDLPSAADRTAQYTAVLVAVVVRGGL